MVKVTFAPSFYESLKKLPEKDRQEVLKIIADLEEMPIEEIIAISEPVTPDNDEE